MFKKAWFYRISFKEISNFIFILPLTVSACNVEPIGSQSGQALLSPKPGWMDRLVGRDRRISLFRTDIGIKKCFYIYDGEYSNDEVWMAEVSSILTIKPLEWEDIVKDITPRYGSAIEEQVIASAQKVWNAIVPESAVANTESLENSVNWLYDFKTFEIHAANAGKASLSEETCPPTYKASGLPKDFIESPKTI